MDVFKTITTRRSIRKFTDEAVLDTTIDRILEAGIWAPSGMNNQPWKFAVITDAAVKAKVSRLTHYAKVIQGASALIAVFLDQSRSYDRTKDVQAIGACIQNMLLTVHSLGLGAVWIGEILRNKDKVLELLGGDRELELMAVIALGHPAEKGGTPGRRKVKETIFFRM